jgi:hypothetical protein
MNLPSWVYPIQSHKGQFRRTPSQSIRGIGEIDGVIGTNGNIIGGMKPLALVIISQGLNSATGFLAADPAGPVFSGQEIALSIKGQAVGIVAGAPEYL